MKLRLSIKPDLVAMMAAEIAAGERAVTAAMREAGVGLKLAWRGQIVGAGLGPRLANSIRSEVFPKVGASLNAAALVWSNLGEFVLPYDAVRRSSDPDATLMAFLEGTYRAAADLGGWDRGVLECVTGIPRRPRPI